MTLLRQIHKIHGILHLLHIHNLHIHTQIHLQLQFQEPFLFLLLWFIILLCAKVTHIIWFLLPLLLMVPLC
uniref:Putative ovule protein n=1 Tax=Solanum chacoense TaxID=4108 RepID=A0A0V0H3K7_SOLCH